MLSMINERLNSLLSDFADVLAIACIVLLLVLITAVVLSVKRAGRKKKKNSELSQRLSATEKELVETNRALAEKPVQSPAEDKSEAPASKPEEPAVKDSEKDDIPDDGVEEVPIGEISTDYAEEKPEETKPKRVSVASPKYTVKFDGKSQEWIVLKSGNTRATRRVKTKQEALAIAKELSKNSDATLVVHKKDGKFQKQ